MKKLIKKNKLSIIITSVLAVIALLVFGWFFIIPKSPVIYGLLGQKITLRKGQELHLVNRDVSVKINRFINSPCPKGAMCLKPDGTVSFDVTVNGKLYKNEGRYFNRKSGYFIGDIKSDYKTYVKIEVREEYEE